MYCFENWCAGSRIADRRRFPSGTVFIDIFSIASRIFCVVAISGIDVRRCPLESTNVRASLFCSKAAGRLPGRSFSLYHFAPHFSQSVFGPLGPSLHTCCFFFGVVNSDSALPQNSHLRSTVTSADSGTNFVALFPAFSRGRGLSSPLVCAVSASAPASGHSS